MTRYLYKLLFPINTDDFDTKGRTEYYNASYCTPPSTYQYTDKWSVHKQPKFPMS